jgi:hypothetical protein
VAEHRAAAQSERAIRAAAALEPVQISRIYMDGTLIRYAMYILQGVVDGDTLDLSKDFHLVLHAHFAAFGAVNMAAGTIGLLSGSPQQDGDTQFTLAFPGLAGDNGLLLVIGGGKSV